MSQIEEHFQTFPVFETNRTILRKISYEDQEEMYSYCRVPEVSKFTVWNTHQSIDDTKEFIDFVLNRYESQKVGPWGIENKETKKIIGSCSFVNWDNRNARAELGYVLAKDYWNQGIMTEVINRIIEFGFKELKLIRIEARCHPDNIGSAKVMEKTGMKFEGILRRHIWAKDDYQDVKIYSIIKDDFESVFGEDPAIR
ncbi:GNAT family protein [Paenibacillus lautus]|jgi:[ribosomal protein S5]-alanine N-acetyltransferase|uniref:GNAT family N-acetyltransferase n=1 Tax=Paenibacillus lautus TaxID=1401 RepID=UPI002DBE545E|nr:GNAT family protein [Paenibacillus lautus]MEC0204853.1 GNAT family protein [Paenibacillus lautus]